MKVEIWSDILCPWCGLGTHRLGQAVARFEHGGQVEVVHRSYQLQPDWPAEVVMTSRQSLTQKYGLSEAQFEATTGRVEELAKADGLQPYVVSGNKVGNTQLAHEFLAYATSKGLHAQAWHHMFRAYFGEVRSIFDVDALLGLAGELGLDREETRQVLTEHRFRAQVQEDARQAQRLGARGVPFTVIDGRYGVPGAQDTDTLLQVLRQAWTESHPVQLVGDAEEICGPDGCAVPATGR
ncbi:DsbA family oxidoreductase [Acrocarpospora catenulata]|uniref:DsbA family oxidoreductase n=1 Tax=Acrocarpospora catenulata TaxID=2836182 RepID=UPI001BD93565|nr:DsbA family oxidoreductase [Acrocarpospora catenulata]